MMERSEAAVTAIGLATRSADDLSAAKMTIQRQQAENEAIRTAIEQAAQRIDALERVIETLGRVQPDTGDAETLQRAITRIAELSRELAASEAAAREVWKRNETLRWTLHEAERNTAALQTQIAEMAPRVLQLEANHSAAQSELSALQAQLEGSQATLAEARISVDQRGARVAELEDILRSTVETKNSEIEAARTDIAALHVQLDGSQATLAEARISVEQRGARVAELESILRSAVDTKNAEIEAARRELEETLAAVEQRRAEVEGARAQLEERAASIRELEAELEAVRGELDERTVHALSVQSELQLMRIAMKGAVSARNALQTRANSMLAKITALEAKLEERRRDAFDLTTEVGHLRTELKAALEVRASLEVLLSEQKAAFSSLEELALTAIAESEAKADELEGAWFELLAELDDTRQNAAALEQALQTVREHNRRLQHDSDRLTVSARQSLTETQRERDEARSEAARLEEKVSATQAALHESREQAQTITADLSIHKVRAIQAELKVAQLEQSVDEGGIYVAHLEQELSKAKEELGRATRWAESEQVRAERLAIELEQTVDKAEATQWAESELETIRQAALAERTVMGEYLADTRRRLQEVGTQLEESARYAKHLEQEVANAQRWALDRDAELAIVQERMNARLDAQERTNAQLGAERAAADEARKRLQAELEHSRGEASQTRLQLETLRNEVASMTVAQEMLRENLAEAEQCLISQTEEIVAAVQLESKQLATLIDTVQSSHFWKLKHWLRNFKVRLLGR